MMRQYLVAICLAWAIIMSIAGLVLPPLGVIDNSLLILIAQLLVFIASLLGISIKNSISKDAASTSS